ncbi:MAG TPA: hypothetical protein VKW08_06350 [Xanthobacteraceae bacterium]|jgi:hypothetical protein|nr:hypothetical protein [Xanthobacteraceae bacterium]
MSRKHGSREYGIGKGRPRAELSTLLALVARSAIVTVGTQPHALWSDWEEQRKSADVDALVLAWIVGHVQGPLHRGRLN